MNTVAIAPGLICALTACVTDIRALRVPRAVIAAGLVLQTLTFVGLALCNILSWQVLANACFGLISAVTLQYLLARCVPGALGFGDITAVLLLGFIMGPFGLSAFVLWWFCMALYAGTFILIAKRLQHRDVIAYVPVMTMAAITAILGYCCHLI
ncbi:peptidase A24 [Bifidobacterium dolichotidis]|uniref:Peptidase A24 n=1 Tax=Bifidobacterium dolichotidis TaxID=2306976 RepID=A0A430FSX4_9BIFI|nr:prepilin peptidase [Bifidobacterium dolichotidis]RSX55951.1 peptidase A24 [Bifidobacterium dolichotidis]